MLTERFGDQGVYLLDEPEAGMSLTSSLALVQLLDTLASEGSQAIVATHSPIVAATPGATILELGDWGWGWRPSTWDDLDLVATWRRFLDDPTRTLRHLFTDES